MSIKDLITIDDRTRKGAIVLLILDLGFLTFLIFFNGTPPEEVPLSEKMEKKVISFVEEDHSHTKKQLNPRGPFDPNELSKEGWLSMGFSEKEVQVILNFRNSGGRFYDKNDLKKVYSISEQDQEQLAPYIRIDKRNEPAEPHLTKEEEEVKVQLFPFDPNELPREKWKRLGLSDGQIDVIHNFEKKGGSFRTKRDLLRVYSIDSSQFKRLEPFIQLPEKQVVYLNNATLNELTGLQGVGEGIGGRILKYRDLLGGFHAISQLNEVYGLDKGTVELNRDKVEVDPGKVEKLDINTLSAKELYRHPYISPDLAFRIIDHREEYGNFKNIEEIVELDLCHDHQYRKIAPYLKAGTNGSF